MKNLTETVDVKKFVLDNESNRLEYVSLLNNQTITITKEQFTYDKAGRALVTVWFSTQLS